MYFSNFYIFFFAACGKEAESIDYLPTYEYVEDEQCDLYEADEADEITEEIEIQLVEIGGVMRPIMPLGSLNIEHFIEDLDYMVYVLENNFALLDVARWAHGADYLELAANARAAVQAMEEPCEDIFLGIMMYHFFPLLGTGHFHIFTQGDLCRFRRNFYLGYHRISRRGMMIYEQLHSPLAERFYLSGDDEISRRVFDELVAAYGMPHNRFARDENEERRSFEIKVIKEDSIAYIYAGNMHQIHLFRSRIINFYREIRNFEHLILDLRDNSGGNIDHFLDLMLRPHLEESIEAPFAFYFFLDGPYVRKFGEHLFTSTVASGYLTIKEPYRPAYKILAEHYLPEIMLADMDRLNYGALAGRDNPVLCPNTIPFDNEPAFRGKIWL